MSRKRKISEIILGDQESGFGDYDFNRNDKDDHQKYLKQLQNKYAIMSDIAYQNNSEERENVLNQYYPDKHWALDDLLSHDQAVVLKNKKTGEAVVSVRGTDVNSKKRRLNDLIADVGIFFGIDKYSDRNKRIENIVDQAIQKYGKDNIRLTGHSLGGKLAQNAAEKYNLPAYLYNVGSTPVMWKSQIIKSLYCKISKNCGDDKILHFNTNNPLEGNIDPVSISQTVLGNLTNVYVKPKNNLNAHTLHNFIDTPIEGQNQNQNQIAEEQKEANSV
jgi:hypothetical protein